MKHFVDIVRYNVEKITSIDFLQKGISFSPDQIDEYASNWFYKDYLNLECEKYYEDNIILYYQYKDADIGETIDSNFITKHNIEYPFIDMHAVLTNGIIRFKTYNYRYTPLKTKTIISSKYLLDNFDIFKLDNYGSKSMSIQFTDYSIQVFDEEGLFIPPDKNFALIYNFTDEYVLILLPKTNSARKIHVVLKPRRLTLMLDKDSNAEMSSSTETTNTPEDDVYEITVTRQYHSDEILPLNLQNIISDDNKINRGRLPDIYTYKEASEKYVDLLSNNVLIQFQRAYFKYLNSKYTWYSQDSDTEITVDISNLPVSYGGQEFKDKYYIDPGFYKNIIQSSYDLSTRDLVQNYSDYEDFKVFKNHAYFFSFLETFIESGRNILDLDIFDERGYKFIQYCHSPIISMEFDDHEDRSEKIYVYISNVNSKKIKVKYTSGSGSYNAADYIYSALKKLDMTGKDHEYFNKDINNFSIKQYVSAGLLDLETSDSGFSKLHIPSDLNKVDGGEYLFEIEYYIESEKNGLSSNILLEPDDEIYRDDFSKEALDYRWSYELKYLEQQYPKTSDGKFYQIRTNLDDVFIPAGMSLEKHGINFSIQTIATPGIKNDDKTLNNNLRSEITNILKKSETETDLKTISKDAYFSSDYFKTSESGSSLSDDDNLSERILNATKYLAENNNISITLTLENKTVKYQFGSINDQSEHGSDNVVYIDLNDPKKKTQLLKDIMTKYSTDEMLQEVLYSEISSDSDYYNSAEIIKNHILLTQYMRPDIIFSSLVPQNIEYKVTAVDSDPFLNAILLDSSVNGNGLYKYRDYTDMESLIKYPTYVFCRYTGKDFDIFKKQLRFSITYNFNIWVMDDLGHVSNYTSIDLNIYNFSLIYCDRFEGANETVASFYFVEPYLDYKIHDPNLGADQQLGEGFYLKKDYSNILFQFFSEYFEGATHNGVQIMGIQLVSISFENKCDTSSGIKILVVQPKDNKNW